jgi:nuclear transport factor 2 (NTF2) superfamily protein
MNGTTIRASGIRSYGNENWEFDDTGLKQRRVASVNDLPIEDGERKFHWLLGRRPTITHHSAI